MQVSRSTEGSTFAFHNALFFKSVNETPSVNVSYVWTRDRSIRAIDQIFTKQNDFEQATLSAATIPWSINVLGDPVNVDANHQFANYWGVEVRFSSSFLLA
jgi:hypothetical protein